MTRIIEQHISDYIDTAIERERVIFNADMKHHIGILNNQFQSDLKLMGETVDAKIRETTREVIKEEVVPVLEQIVTRLDVVVSEVGSINGEIGSIKVEMGTFREEMHALRLDTNRHDKRIARLERAIA